MGGDRRGKGWRGGDEGGNIDSHRGEGAETMTPMMGVGCGRAASRPGSTEATTDAAGVGE